MPSSPRGETLFPVDSLATNSSREWRPIRQRFSSVFVEIIPFLLSLTNKGTDPEILKWKFGPFYLSSFHADQVLLHWHPLYERYVLGFLLWLSTIQQESQTREGKCPGSFCCEETGSKKGDEFSCLRSLRTLALDKTSSHKETSLALSNVTTTFCCCSKGLS